MNMLRRQSRVVYLFVYFVLGLGYIAIGCFKEVNYPMVFWSGTIVWFLGLIGMFIVIPRKFNVKIFTTSNIVLTLLICVCAQVCTDSDKLIYLVLIMQWIMAVMVVTPMYLLVLFIIHSAIMTTLTVLSIVLDLPWYTLMDHVSVEIAILLAFWIANGLVSWIIRQEKESDGHLQSLDDMLKMVYKKQREAKEATKSKSDFLANMSHEIRTPINTVLGMNEMVLRESTEKPVLQYADDIERAGKILLNLVNDILDFSKIESGKMNLNYADYDIAVLVKDLYNLMNPRLSEKGLGFNINVDEDIPTKLHGDDIRIRQIILNLLTNAYKYTENGGVTLDISGDINKQKNTVLLKVRVIDTGMGIKEEDLEHLNDSFVRVDEGRNRNVEGTGLGLAIVGSLLNLMGATLSVKSVYGKGSEFSFAVEQTIVDSYPVGDLTKRLNHWKNTDTDKYSVTFEAPNARLLVVDDNPMNLNVFVGLLKRTKCQVDRAESGLEAIELIKAHKYDIIFLDHMMPEMDGIETLAAINELTTNPNADTPVFMLTANAVAGAKEMFMEKGFDGFLSKPIDPKKLEKTIQENLPQDKVEIPIKKEKKVDRSSASPIGLKALPKVEGLDVKYGYSHTNSVDMLITCIKNFTNMLPAETDVLADCLIKIKRDNDSEAMKLFRVKVHSIKSSATLIGLLPIAGIAASLEAAAREEQADTILTVAPFFLKQCKRYRMLLRESYEKLEING